MGIRPAGKNRVKETGYNHISRKKHLLNITVAGSKPIKLEKRDNVDQTENHNDQSLIPQRCLHGKPLDAKYWGRDEMAVLEKRRFPEMNAESDAAVKLEVKLWSHRPKSIADRLDAYQYYECDI